MQEHKLLGYLLVRCIFNLLVGGAIAATRGRYPGVALANKPEFREASWTSILVQHQIWPIWRVGKSYFLLPSMFYRLTGVRCLRRRIVEAEAEEARLKEELESEKAEQAQKNLEMEVNNLVRHGAASSGVESM